MLRTAFAAAYQHMGVYPLLDENDFLGSTLVSYSNFFLTKRERMKEVL